MKRSRVGPGPFLDESGFQFFTPGRDWYDAAVAEAVRNVFGRIHTDPALDKDTLMLLGDLTPEEAFELNEAKMTTEEALARIASRSAILTGIRET